MIIAILRDQTGSVAVSYKLTDVIASFVKRGCELSQSGCLQRSFDHSVKSSDIIIVCYVIVGDVIVLLDARRPRRRTFVAFGTAVFLVHTAAAISYRTASEIFASSEIVATARSRSDEKSLFDQELEQFFRRSNLAFSSFPDKVFILFQNHLNLNHFQTPRVLHNLLLSYLLMKHIGGRTMPRGIELISTIPMVYRIIRLHCYRLRYSCITVMSRILPVFGFEVLKK